MTKSNIYTVFFAAMGILALGLEASRGGPETQQIVYIDGVSTPVFFNDGDTFQIINSNGKRGQSVRIIGFNSLESYGPVHQWGEWSKQELYEFSKKATENARRGGWHCVKSSEKDVYQRSLYECEDLTLDQISKGYAHAMTATKSSAKKAYIDAQKKAQRQKIGFWEKGVPDYIVTSIHASSEDNTKKPYDRLVSAQDGHSEVVQHQRDYKSCETVCPFTDGKSVGDISDAPNASCMVYVPFAERYGRARPDCLR